MSPSSRRPALPPPDDSGTGTDRDAVLKARFSMPAPTAPAAPAALPTTPSVPAHTPVDTSKGVYGRTERPRRTQRSPNTRDDPAGMRRTSLYISLDAANELDGAVEHVLEALGGDVAKHVILSALIRKAAASADQVTAQLAQERADALEQQLDRLRRGSQPS